jgi:predicted nucleic acid-binding protein
MRVVSNTSPLTNLAVIGRLEWVQEEFRQVVIPQAVWLEISALEHPEGKHALLAATQAGWISVERAENRALVHSFATELDAGEAEALALAISTAADLLLIDESAGRRLAAYHGVAVTGALGIALRAKKCGRVASLAEVIDRLSSEAGFYVSAKVRAQFLAEAGEAGA